MFKEAIQSWKKLALKVSEIQTAVFLMIFYYLVLLLPGIIFRLFTDKLRSKKSYSSQWVKRKKTFTFEDLKRQY